MYQNVISSEVFNIRLMNSASKLIHWGKIYFLLNEEIFLLWKKGLYILFPYYEVQSTMQQCGPGLQSNQKIQVDSGCV
jgi:hypothetical protein